jgi:DnaJ-class molecular chaperone
MAAKKLVKCDHCNGRGRVFDIRNGTVIDSRPCKKCDATGKMPKPRKDSRP